MQQDPCWGGAVRLGCVTAVGGAGWGEPPLPHLELFLFQGWIQEAFLGWGGGSWGLIRGLDFSF